MSTETKLCFAVIERKTWKCVLFDWYYATSIDTVRSLQQDVQATARTDQGLPMEIIRVSSLEKPYIGRKSLKTLNLLDWEDAWADSEILEPKALLCDIVPDKSNALHIVIMCNVKPNDPTPLTSILEDGPQNSKAKKSRSFGQSVNYIRRHQKAPSSGAQNSEMLSTQKLHVPNAIYNGRPLWLTGPALSIFDPIFLKFQSMLAKSPSDISFEELGYAYTIVNESARYFPNESERQGALDVPFHQLLGCRAEPTNLTLGSQQVVPDMHRCVWNCDVPPIVGRTILSFIGEYKNGAGSGSCDPMDQAAKVYESMAVAPQMDKLRKVSCLPTFLMAIDGPQLSLSGAIFLDGVVTKSLMPPLLMSVLDPVENVSERPLTTLVKRVAHVLRTLRLCLEELDGAYAALEPAKIDQVSSRPTPHLVCVESSEGLGQIVLTYERNLCYPRYRHAVFSASAYTPRNNRTVECVVKFAPRYNAEAHKIMGRAGVTAELLHCQFEAAVGMVCVITKYIQEADGRISDEGVDALRKGLALLHENSLAFGDLRDANIILDKKGWPHVVDFDWCGTVGQARYPFDINMEQDPRTGQGLWVKGVKAGRLIEREHDVQMLKKYLDSFSSK